MTGENREASAAEEIRRAENALHEAEMLAKIGMYDGATSRAYYVAFHAASALLVQLGEEARTHRGVYSLLEKRVVIPGHLAAEHLVQLARLQEQRSVADHGASRHIEAEQIDRILTDARGFLDAARVFLAKSSPKSADRGRQPHFASVTVYECGICGASSGSNGCPRSMLPPLTPTTSSPARPPSPTTLRSTWVVP